MYAPRDVSRRGDMRTVICPTHAESWLLSVTSSFNILNAQALLVILFIEHFAFCPSAKYFPISLYEDVAYFNSPSAVAVGSQVWLIPNL